MRSLFCYSKSFLLSTCICIPLSFYKKDALVLLLLYKVGILKESPKVEVGSMVVPYTKTTELKINFFYCNSKRTLGAEIHLSKYSRFMEFKRVIPYMGKLEISVPAHELINSISIDGTLNSPLNKTHELEVKLPRD